MAFEQYTRCEQPADWKPRSYWMITLQSLLLTPLAVPLAIAGAKVWCWIAVAEVIGLSWVIAYCRHFLYHRLVCLGGDQDVVGAVVNVSPPPPFTKFDWDNDYSVNLLLENTEFGVTQAVAEQSTPYGFLIAPQDAITNPPVGLQTLGYPHAVDEHGTGKHCAALHCEFEGAGNYNLMQISQGMLGFAIGALLACAFLPWPADVVLTAMLALAALLGFLLGAIASKVSREGHPSDVDPELGDLEGNDEDNGGLGSGAHILYVRGTWVFDPLHDGWNEIHPVKACSIVGRWDGGWGDQPPDVILRARHGFDVAQAEETQANQARPEHQWDVHPDLDGCAVVVIE